MAVTVLFGILLGVPGSAGSTLQLAARAGVLIPHADVECSQAAVVVQRPPSPAAAMIEPLSR